jgi:hypothetical protein
MLQREKKRRSGGVYYQKVSVGDKALSNHLASGEVIELVDVNPCGRYNQEDNEPKNKSEYENQ